MNANWEVTGSDYRETNEYYEYCIDVRDVLNKPLTTREIRERMKGKWNERFPLGDVLETLEAGGLIAAQAGFINRYQRVDVLPRKKRKPLYDKFSITPSSKEQSKVYPSKEAYGVK